MALAGGLIAHGWEDQACVDFLREVYAGLGKSSDHWMCVRSTRTKADAKQAYTGWPELEKYVAPEVVRRVRELLGMEPVVWADGSSADGFWEGLKDSDAVPAVAPAKGFFTFGGWAGEMPPVEYVVDGLISRGSVNMFVAHGDSMKTWALLSVLSSVADGKPWLGKYPVKQGRVGILDYENGRGEVHRRLRIIQADGSEMGYAFGDVSLTNTALWKTIAEAGLSVLGIDSLAAGSWGVDENSTSAHVPLLFAKELGEKTGTATIFIHHARKGDGKSDKRQEVRGASAIFAACDSVYSFSNEPGEGKARIFAIKTRQGKKPPPVNAQLSDSRGVTWFEDDARELAHAGGNVDDSLGAAILLAITTLPERSVAGVRELASRLGKRTNDVSRVVGVLKERGDLVVIGRRLCLDAPQDRERRIAEAIVADGCLENASTVAKRADVRTSDVEEMERRGKIAKYMQGYGVVSSGGGV